MQTRSRTSSKPPPMIARVVSKERVGSTFIRLTLSASGLECDHQDQSGGHLKLLFPKPGCSAQLANNTPLNEYQKHSIARTYTLVHHRPMLGEIDIDIAIHPGDIGPGGRWARDTNPGDQIVITHPSKKKLPNTTAKSYLFVCDHCSLPAVRSAIKDLPANTPGNVIFNTDDSNDAQYLIKDHPQLIAHHIKRDLSRPASVNAALHLQVLRPMELDLHSIECFVVGECSVVREVKQYLANELMIDVKEMYLSAYWKQNHTQDEHKQSKKADRIPEITIPDTQKNQVLR